MASSMKKAGARLGGSGKPGLKLKGDQAGKSMTMGKKAEGKGKSC